MSEKINRRTLIKNASLLAAGSALLPLVHAEETPELPELQEDDPLAMSLGYKKDATTVDVKKYPKRSGEAGATQFCSNCTFFQEQKKGLGTCVAIPGKWVASQGWCNVWALKLL